MNLQNKTVLITGATDGLGKRLAIELAKQGSEIIVHGRNKEKIAETIEELVRINKNGKYIDLLCDLTNPDQIIKKFSEINKLDILINNAGIWLEGNTIDATAQSIIELINVNLLAPMLITRTLLPILVQSEFAQIVNIASIAGVEIPSGYFHTFYSGVKFGLQGFTEALAKEFDGKNLRVIGYYPGGMETNMFKKAGIEYQKHEPWMFDPQESVEAILFMLTRNKKVNIKRMDLINHLLA